uniref:RING-type E3 ubiquitin transferase n=1 Tax=Hucho hucho TaxID=62062 RepID=A0A4W5L3I5_9TELE
MAAASTGPEEMDRTSEVMKVERQNSEYSKSLMEPATGATVATQRNMDMACGVCLDVVLAKDNPRERRFGILPNCSHCYCLECIRTWRTVRLRDINTVKLCPECRTRSHFFVPSDHWVEDKEEKRKLIQAYKDVMASKQCRYFDRGPGTLIDNE